MCIKCAVGSLSPRIRRETPKEGHSLRAVETANLRTMNLLNLFYLKQPKIGNEILKGLYLIRVHQCQIPTLRLFTRDIVVQSHSVYPNSYVTSSHVDAPMQFFKPMERHYYIAIRPLTRDKVIQSHSVYSNSYINKFICSQDDHRLMSQYNSLNRW
jgi:hypothetical protein